MNQNLTMFGVSLVILTLIVAVVLGFMAEPTSLLPWLLLVVLIAIPLLYRKIGLFRKIDSKDFIEWSDVYSTGINSIDQQHKKLINLINQLQTAVNYSTGEEFERETLEELVNYTKIHFSYEEELLEQNGYPDFDLHKSQHVRMIKKVEEVLNEYEKDRDVAMKHALNFLREWLVNHINGTDKEYCHFLIGKGVK